LVRIQRNFLWEAVWMRRNHDGLNGIKFVYPRSEVG
jgi:hypothetical protein